MKSKTKYVVGIGEALWDVLPEGKKIGGAPANFAYHVSQFGLRGKAVSAVGNDALGAELLENLWSVGLDTLIELTDYPTGTVQVQLNEAGVPTYDICENVAWDNIPLTPQLEALALKTRAVCFGSLAQRNAVSRQTINTFLDTMPSGEGQLKVFDVNLRQHFYDKSIITDSLRRCNMLKLNDEELEIMTPLLELHAGDAEARCRHMMETYGLQTLILTCGTEGSHVFTATESSFVPTPKVTVADTVGAGDSFTATFIAATINGCSTRKAHEMAVAVSAFVCTRNGAMPKIPEEIKKG